MSITLGADPEFVFWRKDTKSEVSAAKVLSDYYQVYRNSCDYCNQSACDNCDISGDRPCEGCDYSEDMHPCECGESCPNDVTDHLDFCDGCINRDGDGTERCSNVTDCMLLKKEMCSQCDAYYCDDCELSVCDDCNISACDYCDGGDEYEDCFMEEAIGTDGCNETGELRPSPTDDAESLANNIYSLVHEAREIAKKYHYELDVDFEARYSALGCHIHLGNRELKEYLVQRRFDEIVKRDWVPIAKRFNPESRKDSGYSNQATKPQPHGLEVRCFPATILMDRELFVMIADSLQDYAEQFLAGNLYPKIKNRAKISRRARIIRTKYQWNR